MKKQELEVLSMNSSSRREGRQKTRHNKRVYQSTSVRRSPRPHQEYTMRQELRPPYYGERSQRQRSYQNSPVRRSPRSRQENRQLPLYTMQPDSAQQRHTATQQRSRSRSRGYTQRSSRSYQSAAVWQNPMYQRQSRAYEPRNTYSQRRNTYSQTTQYYNENQKRRNRTKSSASARAVQKKKAQRRRIQFFWRIAMLMIVVIPTVVVLRSKSANQSVHAVSETQSTRDIPEETSTESSTMEWRPTIKEDFLSISEYNRPGTKLAEVKNIFVHYTANPETSAAQNRSYFENLAETHERSASAHFIIGYRGEIIQCIPLEEEAYAVIGRNNDSISIECCYIREDGKFTQDTYDSLVKMLAWLTIEYDLETRDILRHYDAGGKRCPLYYVENTGAWKKLLSDVDSYLKSHMQ